MGWGTRGQSKTPIIKQSWEKGRGKEKTYPGAGYLYACCAFGDPGCGAPARTQNLFAFGLNSKIFFHHCFTAAAMTYDDCLVKNILRMLRDLVWMQMQYKTVLLVLCRDSTHF